MVQELNKEDLPSVCVIIVNFNGTADTLDCLDSLKEQSYPNTHIVVVDNASDDPEELENALANHSFHLVQLEENNGFASGNNAGVKYAKEVLDPDYILMLNNDTVVSSDFLFPLVEELEGDAGTGACCSHINYYQPSKLTWYGGGYINWKTGTSVHEVQDHRTSPSRDVEFLTGCALLFPIRMIQEIGYLNEDYFLFYEDTEFCVRMKKAGYRLRYVPESVIYHKVSATAGFRSPLANYYGTRNKMHFMSLYANRLNYTFFLLYFSCKTGGKLLFYWLRGKRFKDMRRAIRTGYWDFFRHKTGKWQRLT
ncbi:glycosyltransferase family 2 protein [Halobacillus sp. BAB-2008]|uniref:glycosyltransferase family 2 protein n=1 Tax=Halobacillus sp. BAB-2008 TaxID=1246484 RepID=UPI0002A4FF30|nr:glycosyltransferase family 2 protein [Halobacillus sp. BAB-2008]ELK48580.1 glycosyltransferase [Halobacillus sp. BAB-2008]